MAAVVPELARKAAHPSWISPMLATLSGKAFSRPGWIFEPKLDGVRCLAFRKGAAVRLLSRNQQLWNATFPELVEALRKQNAVSFIVDGEIVAFKGRVTSFAELQKIRHARVPVYYYLFDLLYLDGYDTRQLPLTRRKELLKTAISFKDPLRFVTHRETEGEAYFKEACRKGWEGVIAKGADSVYVSKRSRDWLKFKCVKSQEFVIGGYTDPHGQRVGFGALLAGYYEDGELIYAGKVGTGFDTNLLRSLSAQLASLERKSPSFRGAEVRERGIHWVEPKLVAEVGFTEWTGDGKLRHPRFLGLRSDKSPREVVRERPEV